MKIDLTQQYLNANDTPAVNAETKEPITLKEILLQVCLNEGAKPDEKVKRWSLYRTIKAAKTPFVLLDVEDVALLKKAVTETHSTLVVGQTHEFLEIQYIAAKVPRPAKNLNDYQSVED